MWLPLKCQWNGVLRKYVIKIEGHVISNSAEIEVHIQQIWRSSYYLHVNLCHKSTIFVMTARKNFFKIYNTSNIFSWTNQTKNVCQHCVVKHGFCCVWKSQMLIDWAAVCVWKPCILIASVVCGTCYVWKCCILIGWAPFFSRRWQHFCCACILIGWVVWRRRRPPLFKWPQILL